MKRLLSFNWTPTWGLWLMFGLVLCSHLAWPLKLSSLAVCLSFEGCRYAVPVEYKIWQAARRERMGR